MSIRLGTGGGSGSGAYAVGGTMAPLPGTANYVWAHGSTALTTQFPNGNARLCPLWVPKAVTIDRLGVEVATAGDTTAVVRLGIYNSAADFTPSSLLLDAGTIDGKVAGFGQITINQALDAGLYYLVAVNQGAPTTLPSLRYASGFSWGLPSETAGPTGAIWTQTRTWQISGGATGVLPASPTFARVSDPPLVAARIA